ncbi:3-hydroxyisobutyrate dehydrogenase [Methylacidiphilum kamchatkense Kam1]|uniref:3-hydroxyisobutyrate dehydrogenase n=1 Tax=Methylacidiphilum kamchatkense Kam1 TaxID=1202785 RepID=A0A0C1RLQ2_9BACT|nr:NAD(P)-dependent oxidoreductase [Methylacidiphilum kamchatkense]KIE58987.1 3-hydroxyisobutyrate dehydrogenase [Methylacidiphilum kamchatkense Kam1]QDQ43125.1 3-hydroxyisobutyrate dehydrogenase-like beta-hydroxyacid dehydrogenase [Methylacidiphilum kamchatkense Kam1]
MKIGFIGTGKMGYPMAQNLLASGKELFIYNRTKEKADPLAAFGAKILGCPKEVAASSDVVITMLANDEALLEITAGSEGLIHGLHEEGIHLSMSTVSPKVIQEIQSMHAAKNQILVSAPVFGRPDAAARKELWIITAGPLEAVRKCHPIFQALGRGYSNFGEEPARANIVKILGNFLIMTVIEALSESFSLAQRAKILPQDFLSAINQALFRSPLYENYGQLIVKKAFSEPGFTLQLGFKDATMARDLVESYRVPMPYLDVVYWRFLSALNHGKAELDFAAISSEVFDSWEDHPPLK